jgi:hypothetical protein
MLAALLAAACGLLAVSRAGAQEYPIESVKAAFLYRFTSYVEWPDTALGGVDFTIAVVGADDVAASCSTFSRLTRSTRATHVCACSPAPSISTATRCFMSDRTAPHMPRRCSRARKGAPCLRSPMSREASRNA